MTIEFFQQRPSTTIAVCMGLLVVLGTGVIMAVTESDRPPATAWDGEWSLISSYGGMYEDSMSYTLAGDAMVLTLARGRFRVELERETELYFPFRSGPVVTEYEGTYSLLDTIMTSTWGYVGEPFEVSVMSWAFPGFLWFPELRGDTLTLHCYVDDGLDYTFVRRE